MTTPPPEGSLRDPNKTPSLQEDEAGFVQPAEALTISPILEKLSALREKYLADMLSAREKVKKNFLK